MFEKYRNAARVRRITRSKKGFGVNVYKNVHVEIEDEAAIYVGEAPFFLGISWTKQPVLNSLLKMGKQSQLHVSGKFRIYEGGMIYVNQGAELHLGSGYINNRCNISCFKKITIGQDVVISEGVTIRDSDNHTIEDGNHQPVGEIVIGNHVWIGLNVTILKGVKIGEGCVIAAGAVVTKSIPPFSLAGGVPARVIKENIRWK